MLHQNYIRYPHDVKKSFGVKVKIFLDTFLYLFLSLYGLIPFWMTFYSMSPKQKSVTNITSCNICYIILYRYLNMGFCTIFMKDNNFLSSMCLRHNS